MTLEEAWLGEQLNILHLRVFGYTAYMHIPKEKIKILMINQRGAFLLGMIVNPKPVESWILLLEIPISTEM